jgi:hypothetical protein
MQSDRWHAVSFMGASPLMWGAARRPLDVPTAVVMHARCIPDVLRGQALDCIKAAWGSYSL